MEYNLDRKRKGKLIIKIIDDSYLINNNNLLLLLSLRIVSILFC